MTAVGTGSAVTRRDFGSRYQFDDFNRHRELIALPDYGSNEPWSFGLIPQSYSKLSNCGIETRIECPEKSPAIFWSRSHREGSSPLSFN